MAFGAGGVATGFQRSATVLPAARSFGLDLRAAVNPAPHLSSGRFASSPVNTIPAITLHRGRFSKQVRKTCTGVAIASKSMTTTRWATAAAATDDGLLKAGASSPREAPVLYRRR